MNKTLLCMVIEKPERETTKKNNGLPTALAEPSKGERNTTQRPLPGLRLAIGNRRMAMAWRVNDYPTAPARPLNTL
eukprot:3385772-Lingulodinium_polyedra.AAC.1